MIQGLTTYNRNMLLCARLLMGGFFFCDGTSSKMITVRKRRNDFQWNPAAWKTLKLHTKPLNAVNLMIHSGSLGFQGQYVRRHTMSAVLFIWDLSITYLWLTCCWLIPIETMQSPNIRPLSLHHNGYAAIAGWTKWAPTERRSPHPIDLWC